MTGPQGKMIARKTGAVLLTVAALFVVLLLCASGLRRGVTTDPPAAAPETRAEYRKLRTPVLDLTQAPGFWVDVDYAEGENAAWWPKGEAPVLKEMVETGELPPVAERVGPEPAVYRGFAGIGTYGGDWWRLADDIDMVRLAMQYELKNNQLVRFQPYGEPIRPHLARDVVPSADYKVWTVHLRRGVKWSDGVPFTAEDIIWWWQYVKQDPGVGFIDETMKVNGVAGDIEKVDEFTVRYVFPAANPGWLKMQANAAGALYMCGPKHYLRQFHPTQGDQEQIKRLCEAQVITPKQLFAEKNHPLNPERPKLGPWLFRTYRTNGPWTAVRNPYYFAVDEQGNQLPYMDRLVFRQVSKQLQPKAITEGVASFVMAPGEVDYGSLMSRREAGGYSLRHWALEGRGRLTVIPNRQLPVKPGDDSERQRRELLRNPEFRRALSVAINRRAIIEGEFKGVGEPADLQPTAGVPWYDPATLHANAEYDPGRANRLLDDIGLTQRDSDGYRTLPNGARLTLDLIARPGEVGPLQFLIEDWREIGVRVILQEKPHRLFLKAQKYAALQRAGDGSAGELSWDALGAGAPYWDWYYKGGMYGSEASRAPEIDQPAEIEVRAMRLGQDAGNTFDMVERARMAREVMRMARDQVWAINIATPGPSVAVVRNGLRGVPQKLLSSFMLTTPNNSCPETWYWEDPQTINGGARAGDAYLADRRAAILAELRRATPKPEVAAATTPETTPKTTGLGRLLRLALIGIMVVGVMLLVLRHPFVLRRLVIMVPTLVVISIIVYVGVQLPPGSYLDTVMDNLERSGQREQAQAEMAQLRDMYHLDEGAVKNYFRWTGLLWFTTFDAADRGILQGNLGRSMANEGAFVSDLLGDRLLLTMAISFGTILLTWLVAIPIGVYSAVRQYSPADYVLTVGGFIGMCIPQFVLALVLMLLAKELFGVSTMGLFSARYAVQPHWDWAKVMDLLKHIWLPIIVVGAAGTAGMIRVMRANLLDELKKPYVTTGRAKGLRPMKLLFKYPFRLALNPFIAGIGGLFPLLISGSAIVAIILSLPTVGPLLLDAVMLEDTYMAGSLLLVLSALSVLGVLVSDLLLMALDPRIRMGGGGK